jgi:DNA segregation ATPase FtsK/SpoIIIE, S-DNA-T family
MVGFTLMVFGVLSLMAILAQFDEVVAAAWVSVLKQIFGWGAFLIAIAIFALGALILLPRVGIRVRLPLSRILALEIAFISFLAIAHLLTMDPELESVARAGIGGGQLGYAIVLIPYTLLGPALSLILFLLLFIAGMLGVIGIRRERLRSVEGGVISGLHRVGDTLAPESRLTTAQVTSLADVVKRHGRDLPLMHIRVEPKRLPPSQRSAPPRPSPVQPATTQPEDDLLEDLPDLSKASQNRLRADFDAIGDRTGKKGPDGHEIVIRPDGRSKRYFRLDQVRENRKKLSRNKDLPPLTLLDDPPSERPDEDEINHKVVLLENTLLEFDIDVDVIEVQVGPTVTRFALQPFRQDASGEMQRVKLNRIASYVNDLTLALSAKRLRLEIPVPGTTYMGIEVPNARPSLVSLRAVYESATIQAALKKAASPLYVPLGLDVGGQAVGIDIASMPHLLIAGTTGSGKSVAIAAIATALILDNPPEQLQLVMLDPKRVELARFNGLPHLVGPVETDLERIIEVLRWCTQEMDRRYRLLEERHARNLAVYNEKLGRRSKDRLPHMVILIDEIGDLMMAHPEETERSITRLAQMARAVGIHLVMATQRPSVDVITGLIKANFPGRIAFSVASGVDSRVILDSTGAESLLGNGDMLFQDPSAAAPRRVQGCYVSDTEVRAVVAHWVAWQQARTDAGEWPPNRLGPWNYAVTRRELLSQTDPALEEAIALVIETQEASASYIQRQLNLGYPRAARIMDLLVELGVVGDQVGGGKARQVIIPKGQDPFVVVVENWLRLKGKKHAEPEDSVRDS